MPAVQSSTVNGVTAAPLESGMKNLKMNTILELNMVTVS